MRNFFSALTLFFFAGYSSIFGQQVFQNEINPDILHKRWPAMWIACPDAPGKQYGVYYFRKSFDLSTVPEKFIIHVSADNRYRLFVNGQSVSTGPARGDLQHWRFESVNIRASLVKGKNVLAAVVWNFGDDAPNSQMSLRTGFILAGNTMSERMVNTDSTWKASQDFSYSPITGFSQMLSAYYVVGPGERIEGQKHVWDWEKTDYNDSDWKRASPISFGQPRTFGTNGDWMLIPRPIPLMEEKELRLKEIRSPETVKLLNDFLTGHDPLTISAYSQDKIIIDQGFLTKAYPVLKVSGGKNAEIKLSYAESMYNPDGSKGNRNEIEGKEFRGNYDIFIPDGQTNRKFSPLWFRTYRYLQLEIKTADEPITLNDLYGILTAYPLMEIASFKSDNNNLDEIWKTGWRTARLCASEIYYDCPYYEQMQYVGDTRIQSLISLYVSGDDRLMKNALELYDVSRIPDGLTQSRYPASSMQIIPPFSLFWTLMVHDYWMNRDDPEYVKSFLPGVESVLGWFERRIAGNNMLGPLEWWNFVDWSDEWAWDPVKGYGGVPQGANEGGSSIITLQFAYALKMAAELEGSFGNSFMTEKYLSMAEKLTKATFTECWDSGRKLLADTPLKSSFSQHANIFGILTGTIPEAQSKEVLESILRDKSLIQATIYFRFYLVQAFKKAGMGNIYLDNLDPWYEMLDKGLSTFAEKLDPTRSDCHAWSASPNYDLLATVCGIEPGSPGFKSVNIHPCPGNLNSIEGSMPHPLGMITVRYRMNGQKMEAEVELPAGLYGTFQWNGINKPLKEGKQSLAF